MIWLQGAACFLVWVGYGVYQSRRSDSVRQWAIGIARTKRVFFAALMMAGSIAGVFACLLLALANNGFGNNGMAGAVWLGVGAVGLLFVHAQTLSTALLVTAVQASVTAESHNPSTKQGHHETDSR